MAEAITPYDQGTLPEALHNTSPLTRVLCLFAFGHPDLKNHWELLQSKEEFEDMKGRLSSILTITMTAAGLLLATSGVFLTTSSPVLYFDYTSPVPFLLLFISFMLATIALLASGLSMIRWLHTDRQWAQEQLRPGGYCLSYLSSIVMPMSFVGCSLNCFIFAMMIAGFYSPNTVCRTITGLWLIVYAVSVGTMSMDLVSKYAKSLQSC